MIATIIISEMVQIRQLHECEKSSGDVVASRARTAALFSERVKAARAHW